MAYPTVAEVRAWIQVPPSALSDPQLQGILDAELNRQVSECPRAFMLAAVDYPPELRQALLFRCAFEVQRRGMSMGGPVLDEFGGAVPSGDMLSAVWRWLESAWTDVVIA